MVFPIYPQFVCIFALFSRRNEPFLRLFHYTPFCFGNQFHEGEAKRSKNKSFLVLFGKMRQNENLKILPLRRRFGFCGYFRFVSSEFSCQLLRTYSIFYIYRKRGFALFSREE